MEPGLRHRGRITDRATELKYFTASINLLGSKLTKSQSSNSDNHNITENQAGVRLHEIAQHGSVGNEIQTSNAVKVNDNTPRIVSSIPFCSIALE
jgi:hypothetical protein